MLEKVIRISEKNEKRLQEIIQYEAQNEGRISRKAQIMEMILMTGFMEYEEKNENFKFSDECTYDLF